MAAFEYEALDPTGKRVRGVVSADTPRQARRDLKAKKLTLLKIDAADKGEGGDGSKGFSLRFAPRVGNRDLTLITRQLATLVNAAAPVEEALQAVALQAEKPGVRKSLMNVRTGITEGQKLSQAMAQQPRVFNPLYRSMVAAGEASGTLGPVLDRLAEHMEKSEAMRAKVRTAMVYPIFLSLVAISVVVMLMTFVVPKVVEQFDSMGRELPMLTQVMIGISDALQAYGLYGALALVGGVFLFARAMKSAVFRRRIDGLTLRLPLIGRLSRELQAARLARTMAALISSGTPLLEGLSAARGTVSNTVLKDAINEVLTQVREGSGFSAAMRRTKAFPPLVVYMAAMGEKSGSLDVMLTKAADYMENEFEAMTSSVMSLLEPVIIVIMGGVVGTIIMAILLPILQFNSAALL